MAGIEHNVGKPSDEMAEKELTTAMKKLGVQPQELTEREQSSITESMTGSQSPYCEVLVKKGD